MTRSEEKAAKTLKKEVVSLELNSVDMNMGDYMWPGSGQSLQACSILTLFHMESFMVVLTVQLHHS